MIHIVDLLMGGSPCTFWSKAKAHTAKVKKELDTNGEGWKLFKKYIDAKKILQPKYFLYENNEGIPQTIVDAITYELKVEPIMINSNLVSAQNRKRLYWTNIKNVKQPEDKKIYIKDIMVNDPELIKVDPRIEKTMKVSKNYIKYDLSGKGYYSQQDRAYFKEGKFPTVPRCRTETKFNVWLGNNTYKKTCPLEVERMQTLPDNYTDGLPKTRRFEAIGNGWTVDVITHILNYIPESHLSIVISLFDGISCGQVALGRANKTYDKYFASEIDDNAIKITMNNYPNTIQLGDVNEIDWNNFIDN